MVCKNRSLHACSLQPLSLIGGDWSGNSTPSQNIPSHCGYTHWKLLCFVCSERLFWLSNMWRLFFWGRKREGKDRSNTWNMFQLHLDYNSLFPLQIQLSLCKALHLSTNCNLQETPEMFCGAICFIHCWRKICLRSLLLINVAKDPSLADLNLSNQSTHHPTILDKVHLSQMIIYSLLYHLCNKDCADSISKHNRKEERSFNIEARTKLI